MWWSISKLSQLFSKLDYLNIIGIKSNLKTRFLLKIWIKIIFSNFWHNPVVPYRHILSWQTLKTWKLLIIPYCEAAKLILVKSLIMFSRSIIMIILRNMYLPTHLHSKRSCKHNNLNVCTEIIWKLLTSLLENVNYRKY